MRPFDYRRADTVEEAVDAAAAPGAMVLAGGTTVLDLMKDGVLHPRTLIDIGRLPLRRIEQAGDELRIGSGVTMEQLAGHPTLDAIPVLRQALLAGASVQLRNMATIGGNLLQRTRCRYFRDPTVPACNKRDPGSGCAAVTGHARMHAIVGVSENCIAAHASDLAVALLAVEARVQLRGPDGEREILLGELYRTAADDPAQENTLRPGELITAVVVPRVSSLGRSGYLKVRDRASYEFAVVSVAAVIEQPADRLTRVRIAWGGVASVPWRASAAEQALAGRPATAAEFAQAAATELTDAFTVPGTAFKIELARRALVRQLTQLTGSSA